MREFAVRRATVTDAGAIARVLARSYGVLYRGWYADDVLRTALPVMSRSNPTLIDSGRYFVAEADGQIVACGGWSAEKPGFGAVPRLAHVRHFATDPDYINRGCGGAILTRSVAEAARTGFVEMEAVSSLTAEAFYARHGFVQVSMVRTIVAGSAFSCVLMRRRLEGA
jgi:N-acetylglutamate synthase-like GNAT family acetyltransferase